MGRLKGGKNGVRATTSIECKSCGGIFTEDRPSHVEGKHYCSLKCSGVAHREFKHSPESKQIISQTHKGRKHSPEHIAKRKKKGEDHYRWGGGVKLDSSGYVRLHKPDHPFCDVKGYVKEHRLEMEKHIYRYLKPEEVVHHMNEDKIDNKIENLKLFPNNKIHMHYHGYLNYMKWVERQEYAEDRI